MDLQSFTCNSLAERFPYRLDNHMKSSTKLFSRCELTILWALFNLSLTYRMILPQKICPELNYICLDTWNIHSPQQSFNTELNLTSNTCIMIS